MYRMLFCWLVWLDFFESVAFAGMVSIYQGQTKGCSSGEDSSVASYAEDVCFRDENLYGDWRLYYIKLKCNSNGTVVVNQYPIQDQKCGFDPRETNIFPTGACVDTDTQSIGFTRFICQDVQSNGETCVPAQLDLESKFYLTDGVSPFFLEPSAQPGWCNTNADPVTSSWTHTGTLGYPDSPLIAGVMITSCATCSNSTPCTPRTVAIRGLRGLEEQGSATYQVQSQVMSTAFRHFIPFSEGLSVNSIELTAIAWPEGGQVNVVEMTACNRESPTIEGDLNWSPCNAQCGERFYQQRMSYCQGDTFPNRPIGGNFQRRNIYSTASCECGTRCETTQLCVSGDIGSNCDDDTWEVRNVVATSGNQKATISWTPPSSYGADGAEAVIKWYLVMSWSENGKMDSTTVTFDSEPDQPLIWPSEDIEESNALENGREYTFGVQLRNDLSMLSKTILSAAVIPKDLDVINLQDENVIARNGEIEVSWNMPTYHGAPIKLFFVRVTNTTSSLSETFETTSSRFVITDVRNGEAYHIAVKYINEDDYESAFGSTILNKIPRGTMRWKQVNSRCSGKCGDGKIGQYGTGTPDCVDENDVLYETILLMKNGQPGTVCDETLESDDDCVRDCPQPPLGVKVEETYNGAVTIMWDIVESDIEDDPIAWYFVVVDFGKPDSYYQMTNLTSATVQGLENGKRYSFQVRSMTKELMKSDLSTAVTATPSSNKECLGGCDADGGRCKNGICWCWSGWYGAQCQDYWLLEITSPNIPKLETEIRDMRVGCDGVELDSETCGDGYRWRIDWEITQNNTYDDVFQTSTRPRPDLLLFKKTECDEREDKFCLPRYVTFRNDYTGYIPLDNIDGLRYRYPGVPEAEGLGEYYATVFVSPSLHVTTTGFLDIQYNLAWCNGKINDIGDIIKGDGVCTDSGKALEHSVCEEYDQSCICDISNGWEMDMATHLCVESSKCDPTCGIYGQCEKGKCQCVEGFQGPRCRVGPKCRLRCRNEGYPMGKTQLGAASPIPTIDCEAEKCMCNGNWEGELCERCGIACANGGRPDGECTMCNCPNWYDVSSQSPNKCLSEHQKMSILLNLQPDDYLLGDKYRFAELVKNEVNNVFIRNGMTGQDIVLQDAVSSRGKIRMEFTIPKGMVNGRTSTDALKQFRFLVENVKSDWYTHYILSRTDPASFTVTQREKPRSELSTGSRTHVISQIIILLVFLIRLM